MKCATERSALAHCTWNVSGVVFARHITFVMCQGGYGLGTLHGSRSREWYWPKNKKLHPIVSLKSCTRFFFPHNRFLVPHLNLQLVLGTPSQCLSRRNNKKETSTTFEYTTRVLGRQLMHFFCSKITFFVQESRHNSTANWANLQRRSTC